MPRSSKSRIAYEHQKTSARRRGIRFLITFEEWVKWWEDNLGSDWMTKRGRQEQQYCMARFKDKGSYRLTNVKCITNAENRAERESYNCGEKNHFAKLTKEQVTDIRSSKLKRSLLAQKYGVSISTINRIVAYETWR